MTSYRQFFLVPPWTWQKNWPLPYERVKNSGPVIKWKCLHQRYLFHLLTSWPEWNAFQIGASVGGGAVFSLIIIFRKKPALPSKVALFSKSAPQRSQNGSLEEPLKKKLENSSFSLKEELFWLLWGTVLAPPLHCFQPFLETDSSLSKVALF